MARDYTKYTIEGVEENLNKRQLVFSIIKDYLDQNESTLSQLKDIFTDDIQGSKGIIKMKSEINDFKRFSKDSLRSGDGIEFYVSNQWGENINEFISLAENLGYSIEKDGSASDSDEDHLNFDITELSIQEFKKLIRTSGKNETLKKNVLKQVELNIDFWSYLLIYDNVVNDGVMELSEKLMDQAADIFLIEWYEIHDEQISLAQFVLDKLGMDFEEVNTNIENSILFKASFGTYLYFSLKEFTNVEDIEQSDIAGYLASNDHTLIKDGEDVFDRLNIGDDWIITMADEWLMYCGFDSADYEGDCGVHLVNAEYREFSIDYERMAEDLINHFS